MTSLPHTRLNAHQFSRIYGELGIDLDTLGCVMLDVEPAKLDLQADLGLNPDDDLYTSDDASRFWLRGAPVLEKAHVTLLYGLLTPYQAGVDTVPSAGVTAAHVDEVLGDWVRPEVLELGRIREFPSPYGEGDVDHQAYVCLVAEVPMAKNPAILEAHQRLSFLPHIDTHAEYTPHLTLAYVKNDPIIVSTWKSEFTWAKRRDMLHLRTTGLDYGTSIGGTR